MKRMATPLLLMSAGARLISTQGLQQLLPRFSLSLCFSIVHCICLERIAILALEAHPSYKTGGTDTRAGMISHHHVSRAGCPACNPRPPNQNSDIPRQELSAPHLGCGYI